MGEAGRSLTKWLVAGSVLFLVGVATLVSGGALANQTSVSVQEIGDRTSTLGLNISTSSSTINTSPGDWFVTTSNAVLSSVGTGFAVLASNSSISHPTVVTETVGLNFNSTVKPYLHLDFGCSLGTQATMAIGWKGWNNATGPAILASLSTYPGLLAGLEIKYGIIWINSGYPNSPILCSGQQETLVINLKHELSRYGLSPSVGGLQVKSISPGKPVVGPVLQVYSGRVDDTPNSYVEVKTVGGHANPISSGSVVLIIAPPKASIIKDYFPKRTFVSYEIDATAGTKYSVFAVTNLHGTVRLFGVYAAFNHSLSSSQIGTTIDFVNGAVVNGSLEPLTSLSSLLSDGQIAIIFSPVDSPSIGGVRLSSVQTTWGLLPFGSSGFALVPGPNEETTIAVLFMLTLGTAIPLLLFSYWWLHVGNGRWTPRRVTAIFLAAAALRFGLAPVTGFIDTDNFAATSSLYFGSGIFSANWVSLPGFLYPEIVSYFPYALLRNLGFNDWSVLAHSTFAVETVFVKVPSILADLGVAYLLWKLSQRFRPSLGFVVPALYLFNPLTTYLSGVYGQYDDVFVFLLIASLYSVFVRKRFLLAGFLLGATAVVNPVGFAAWIPIFTLAIRARIMKPLLVMGIAAMGTFALGIAPLFIQSNYVFQTAFERLLTGIPGDSIIGTTYTLIAFGQAHVSSVGYGLSFRFLLELLGVSIGSTFYPLAAGVALVAFTFIVLEITRKKHELGIRVSLAYTLGVVALFEFFFPTVFLQFALWPMALLLCLYLVAGDRRYLSLTAMITLLTGVGYVVFVDKAFDRAVGVGGELIADLRFANSVWAMIGLVYSALMVYLVILSVNDVRDASNGSDPSEH